MSLDLHPQSDAASAPTDSGTTSGSDHHQALTLRPHLLRHHVQACDHE